MVKKSLKYRVSLPYRVCALLLALSTGTSPVIAAAAAPTIPGFYGAVPMPGAPAAGTLPVLRPGGTLVGATVGAAVGNTLTVNQTQSQATIDWKSFNLAAGSVVLFNQKQNGVAQSQWVALNRIYDANPSLIFGNLKADGKVYLINRNGILFGPGSQVNVHSLAASNLNISDANFAGGKLRFSSDPYDGSQGALSGQAYVSNYGSISTDSGGSVFLVGPNVVNAGSISSPSGKINLIGMQGSGEVENIEITADATGNDVTYSDLLVPGTVYNAESGRMITEAGGRIGMYGATVQNDGLIRAVTALKKGGVVFLSARDRVITGEKSVIETPVDGSTETAAPSFLYNPGVVSFNGLYTKTAGSSDLLNTLSLIEHQGAIVAPSGTVTLTAKDRIFLGDSSSIDVSGLWLDRAASANLINVQLNSVYLRDDYGQKSGVLLGQKATVDLLTGSNIGNLSSYYLGGEKSAQQRSTNGGTILFGDSKKGGVVLGELVMKQGARIDFSGGGTHYASGTMATSRLISGNRVYELATAPQWLQYDRVADSQTRSHERFGISEQFNGLHFGGGSSVQDLTAARVVGSDAGTAQFKARVMVLDGTLLGEVTRGLYQTAVTKRYALDTTTSGTPDNPDYRISVARGLEEPVGGTVIAGEEWAAVTTEDNKSKDFTTTSITVRPTTTSLAASFGAADDLGLLNTEISASMLNRAGLSSVKLFANTTITTEQGAGITLLPGGSYTARARAFDYQGSIDIAGGTVEMTTRPNVSSYATLDNAGNPLYRQVLETIYLAPGSRISTAGLEIDNSAAGNANPLPNSAHIAGGTITIQEMTEQGSSNLLGTSSNGHSVVVATDALLDVSGGYLIAAGGKIGGGNAGKLELKGSTLSLAGELRGFSLAGKNGGEIRLHAGEVQVAQRDLFLPSDTPMDATIPEYLLGKLVLGEDRLKDTGFARISLTAINDLSFLDGAVLAPSLVKRDLPVPAIVAQSSTTGNIVVPAGYHTTAGDYLGTTAISLQAGLNIYGGQAGDGPLPTGGTATNSTDARIIISSGTGLKVAPGGTISLNAPAVEIAGTLTALGATVSVKATQAELTLKNGGAILAGGFNRELSTTVAGLPAGYSPQAGGSVTLESTSSTGGILLEAGSKVDVSGSAPAEQLVAGADGVPVMVAVAGDPGTLNLSYVNTLTLEGELSGKGKLDGVRGASLKVVKSANDLQINQADFDLYLNSGFDALSFASPTGSILFPVRLDATVGRSLTLDAQRIAAAAGGNVTLLAPWVTLKNTSLPATSPLVADNGTGRVTLGGGYLDLQGSVLMDGFQDVTLRADHDLRLTDRAYTVGQTTSWQGSLGVTGNLAMEAARVYPTSMTEFTITSKGKTSILPAATPDTTPLYSAGGSLTILAEGGIEHRGILAAPMGNITLDAGAEGRVYLAEGSSITTAGSAAVSYGSYDGSTWTTKYINDSNKGDEVTEAPQKSITLAGNEVIVREGATQDVSGGGSVYTTLFQSGLPGSVNPLTTDGRYVILADNSVRLPGKAIYLDAAPEYGLKAGVYSVLPAEYAFLPGALVLEKTKLNLTAGQKALSTQGYQVVAGYETVTDTSITSRLRTGYSIRSATDVLEEGDFTEKRFTAANGGNFTLQATGGAAYAGTLTEHPLTGFSGGMLSFSAKNVLIRETADTLDPGFDFGSALPDTTLQLTAAMLSSRDIKDIRLGDRQSTETVTVQTGAGLMAPSLTLSAHEAVTIEGGGSVRALGGNNSGGTASVVTPSGTFVVEKNGELRAKNGIRLDVGGTLLNGEMSADNGSMSLTADRIVFAGHDATRGAGALYLTDTLLNDFENYTDLTLVSRSDMEFLRDLDLETAGSLTLDAAKYLGSTGAEVSLTAANRLTLLNSGTASQTATLSADATASLSLTASEIVVAPRLLGTKGNIVFDEFGSVALNSSNDLTLKGAGTIKTPGDLTLSAARVTTSFDRYDADPANPADVSIPYTAADITLDARSGQVRIVGNGRAAGATSTPGGSLEILGASITVGDTNGNATGRKQTVLDVASGQLDLTATGDIVITDKTSILAKGSKSPAPMQSGVYQYASGGRIAVHSSTGKIDLARGSTLDVSASDRGDAGAITLSAAAEGVTMAGAVKGSAGNGKGGSFTIDSATLDGSGGLDGLSKALSQGGLNDLINIRSRAGDLSLAVGSTLAGREIVVAADAGAIDLHGKIKADGVKAGDTGGRVELYAGTALTLEAGSAISAKGSAGANGGTVSLSTLAADKIAGNYALRVQGGAGIEVSGGAGATGGSVSLRAYQMGGNDVNIASLPADAVTGASRVSVEAARSYRGVTDIGAADRYLADADNFMKNGSAIRTRLFGDASPNRLQAGIELASAAGADLTLDKAWDLSQLRPGGEAGVVTLRAGKNLLINQHLIDAPTAMGGLHSTTMQDSWGINLIAGGAATAANYRAVANGSSLAAGTGELKIALGKAVYSENAPIAFAAGKDVTLSGWSAGNGPGYMINSAMRYNLGSYGGGIRGQAGNDLNLKAAGSAIQTALGDIDIRGGGNLDLGSDANSSGAIRTTGEYDKYDANGNLTQVETMPGTGRFVAAGTTSYWTYQNGGSIALDLAGSVQGNLSADNGWDGAYIDPTVPLVAKTSNPWYLAAGFGGKESSITSAVEIPVTVGIATMGDGDISVRTGGSLLTQVGAFGKGDLEVKSGGEMIGRFRVMNGTANLTSGGGFGKDDPGNPTYRSIIEMAASQVKVVAQGDVNLGAVLNPDNSRDRIFWGSNNKRYWNLTYDQHSAASITSLAGNATFYGTDNYAGYTNLTVAQNSFLADRKSILPATFSMAAAGNLNIGSTFSLAPSESGNLSLSAIGNINGSGSTSPNSVTMNDVDAIGDFYGRQLDVGTEHSKKLLSESVPTDSLTAHAQVNHLKDSEPVLVAAGNDINNIRLVLNKHARITAGNDIRRLDLIGQNNSPDSVTMVSAAGSIDQGITGTTATKVDLSGNLSYSTAYPEIVIGGPGTLLVQAGESINLGDSRGIQSIGNLMNRGFSGGATDSTIIVAAGAKSLEAGAEATKATAFFKTLDEKGSRYSELKAAGKDDEAKIEVDAARAAIKTYFVEPEEPGGDGSLTMVDSEISSGKGDMYIMTRGDLNVGKTALQDPTKLRANTGINSTFGGGINIFTGNDINVNESRVMTFMGGNMVIWSDQGDINAGRGSKTTVSSAGQNDYKYDENGNIVAIIFKVPAVGSGLRALTYDPDGSSGPLQAPEPGDIHAYAPSGAIDAGEAGIAGGKLILGATQVLNAKNISFSAGSVGVPTGSDNSISLGALGGNSSLADSGKMIEQSSSVGAAKERNAQQTAAVDDFLSKWLDLRIISFDDDGQAPATEGEGKGDRDKAKKQEKK
ncbi:MAG: hypothetical protein A2075_11625 [Geobacteraceae bacterium GWC2_58_44]|nr:MAG: hypothetical protein A2075_11625 [Geobacteraceae bacterium GWC2_58_44]HBG04800.1 hypothetical protein [Geobacter sp.]